MHKQSMFMPTPEGPGNIFQRLRGYTGLGPSL
jgi:hypothetical protein